tara:strand:- start:4554 stop:4871 length:318 start_codon:yes stop_codon:yes gene_type:complete
MFDDRKKQFEKKFELDSEKKFKVIALRNRYLAKWAANQQNISEKDLEKYTKEVLLSDFEKPGDEDVVEKLHKDFAEAQLDISANDIRKKIDHYYYLALKEIEDNI